MPRVCPSGFVCDVTGAIYAEQPCPAGYHCPLGTVTSATTCGNFDIYKDGQLSSELELRERTTTIRKGQSHTWTGLMLGGRNAGCFDNSTEDFGLQTSIYPSRFWSERHMLPLDHSSQILSPRGRFCLDDSCLKVSHDVKVDSDGWKGYHMASARPIPCPKGTFCHPGTISEDVSKNGFSFPQTCLGSSYCPEGSPAPNGIRDCPRGSYCRFGVRKHCPVGSFCPRAGLTDPHLCEPGTFNYLIGQSKCTQCPQGYFCPGYGRVDPSICTPGNEFDDDFFQHVIPFFNNRSSNCSIYLCVNFSKQVTFVPR